MIVAIVEGRGLAKGEIGMASIDLKRPELILSQFSDSQTYAQVMTKLQVMYPVEVIMPSTAWEGGNMTKLFKLISDEIPLANLATVQRKYFNETKGLQYIKELCVPEYSTVEMEVATKYYCLATAAALLKYVEYIQNAVYAPRSLKISFKGPDQTTMIDVMTAKNLELISNARDPASKHSLFGVLNYTSTPGGTRLLRSNILQPPCDMETINLRLECVQELTENEDMFYNVESVLKRFLDVDHLLSLCVQIPKHDSVKVAESRITKIIQLKHTLELVQPLQMAIKSSVNPLLSAFSATLEDVRFVEMAKKIQSVLHDDTHYEKNTLNMRTQRCFAIRSGMNGLLDVARRTYTEIIDDIAALATQLSSKHDLPLKVSENSARGFYMQVYTGPGAPKECQGIQAEQLPSEFVKVCKHRNTLSFTTSDLIKLNDRAQEATNEIYLMTNAVLNELMDSIRSQIGCLYKLTECVAMLDMLHCFANACTLSSYVRPEFTDTLAVKQSRHPILEKISYEPPVPNNIYASQESNFIVITGPNMSGKSTYLKQVALLHIMAQIGCFVPAQYASFRVANQIFSRIGSDDDIETNASTFMLEMRETNYILQNVRSNSLIIMDELGRGTSSEEGVGICHAVCEYLLHLKAFTFFATHFLELTGLSTLYPSVENYHFEVGLSQSGFAQTHILTRGKVEQKNYGLHLALVSNVPASVLTDAKSVAERLNGGLRDCQQLATPALKLTLESKLAGLLIQAAKNSSMDRSALQKYFHHLKTAFKQSSFE